MTPKKAAYIIIFLAVANIVLTVCSFMELNKEKPLPSLSIPAIDSLVEDTKIRQSIILQALLIGQHKEGLHEGDNVGLCPACQEELQEQLRITEI